MKQSYHAVSLTFKASRTPDSLFEEKKNGDALAELNLKYFAPEI
jgi:hypothetical protein